MMGNEVKEGDIVTLVYRFGIRLEAKVLNASRRTVTVELLEPFVPPAGAPWYVQPYPAGGVVITGYEALEAR